MQEEHGEELVRGMSEGSLEGVEDGERDVVEGCDGWVGEGVEGVWRPPVNGVEGSVTCGASVLLEVVLSDIEVVEVTPEGVSEAVEVGVWWGRVGGQVAEEVEVLEAEVVVAEVGEIAASGEEGTQVEECADGESSAVEKERGDDACEGGVVAAAVRFALEEGKLVGGGVKDVTLLADVGVVAHGARSLMAAGCVGGVLRGGTQDHGEDAEHLFNVLLNFGAVKAHDAETVVACPDITDALAGVEVGGMFPKLDDEIGAVAIEIGGAAAKVVLAREAKAQELGVAEASPEHLGSGLRVMTESIGALQGVLRNESVMVELSEDLVRPWGRRTAGGGGMSVGAAHGGGGASLRGASLRCGGL